MKLTVIGTGKYGPCSDRRFVSGGVFKPEDIVCYDVEANQQMRSVPGLAA